MHFNTPQDRITKEMIMDYQQAQQEKHYDDGTNKLKYEPTGLKDIANVESLLETYKPIDFKPVGYTHLGSAVDENALRVYKTELNDLYKELDIMKNIELKKGENKLKKENSQLMIAKTRVQEKIDEMTELGNEIVAHKERLKEIQDEISVFHTTSSISASPGASTLLKRLQKEETNEIADIKEKEKHLNGTLGTELVNEENEVIRHENDKLNVEKQIEDYKKNKIGAKEKEIEDANLLVIQAQENLKENQDEMQKVKNKNKEITQKYTDTFNMANRDRYSVQQDINESEKDYLDRIKQIESQPYDPTIFKEKATNEGNLNLKDNLRNSLRDEVKITEIVKTFTPEEVFMINTNWKEIQDQLRVKFGVNNPNKTVKDYNEEIISIIETLQSKPYGTTILPSDTTTAGSYSTVTKPSGSTQTILHSDGSASDFESTVENNSLYIKNVNEQKAVWIKIGAYTASKTHIMFSINTNTN
jgi:DNA repair exonuclease SbcCD ATPase subunit